MVNVGSVPVCVECLNEIAGEARPKRKQADCKQADCLLHETCFACGGETDGRRLIARGGGR